ncbi:hypothetical protein KFV08_07780 [Macrococcoides canis]|uniref:hypothetical protein n=1 Tax=Macrococcoides canis TaxID=1855823 RepID=UPI00207CBC7C|nr:hypothetical protein [Macrococcus canis]MCO4095716.1 hypothetical protein [Macrococcus canis]UTH08425.1 hypothetical protein KFV08_07780 [Macrococcus canis]
MNSINTMLNLLNKQKTVKALYLAAKDIERKYKDKEINDLEYYAMKQQFEEIVKERLDVDMKFEKFMQIVEISEQQTKKLQDVIKLNKSGLLTKEQAKKQAKNVVFQLFDK